MLRAPSESNMCKNTVLTQVTIEVVPRAVGTLEDVTKVIRGQGRGQVKL